MQNRWWIKLMLGVVVAGLWTRSAGAVNTNALSEAPAKSDAVAAKPKVDPAAEKVLRALAQSVRGMQRLKCEVSLLMTTEMEGMKQEITSTYAFAMERPNKLVLRHVRGMAGNTVVCDGKHLIIYAGVLNQFEEKPAPKGFETLFQASGPMTGNMLFLDNLLRDDIYAAIMEGVNEVKYAGKEQVEGQECHRLKFFQDEFDWDLWVATGDHPAVVRVLSDMSKSVASENEHLRAEKGMKMEVLNRFSGWQGDPDLPEDTFVFKVPEGASKTDTLFGGEEEEQGALPPNMDLKKMPEPAPEGPTTNAPEKHEKGGKEQGENGKDL